MDTTAVETINNANPLIFAILPIGGALIAAFTGAFCANLFQNKSELKRRKKLNRNRLIKSLYLIKKQFQRNAKRLVEFIEDVYPGLKPTGESCVTIRLFTFGIETNLQSISGLNDEELFSRIIRTFEEHTHINRKWDYLYDFHKTKFTENPNPELIKTTDLNVIKVACENVLKWTKEDIELIDKKISTLKG